MLAAVGSEPSPSALPSRLRYLTERTLPSLFDFAPDMSRLDVEPNRVNNPVLVRYDEEEWQRWAR